MLLKTYFVYYSFKRVPTLTKWIPYYAMVMDKYPLGSGYQESDVKQNISDAMLHLLIMWSLWQCFIFFSFEHLYTLIRHWYNCKQNKCWFCLTDDTRLLCWHYYALLFSYCLLPESNVVWKGNFLFSYFYDIFMSLMNGFQYYHHISVYISKT